MCIIAIKNKGIQMPNEEVLETMFKNNSDGAGFMYAVDDTVIIEKGFMSYKSFRSALKKVEAKYDVASLPLVMHFRIATSGQVDGGTCHPFPISNKRKILRKQYIRTDIGVVHNGIISIDTPDNMSDTMQYIANRLSIYQKLQSNFYVRRKWQKRIESEIKSKMAFLDNTGEIYTIGDFVTESDGMVYSNRSYEKQSYFMGSLDSLFDYTPYAKLSPIEGYIVDSDGHFIDSEDGMFLISKRGDCYEYDYILDLATRIDAKAYTYEGLPFYYDAESATYFYVSEGSI